MIKRWIFVPVLFTSLLCLNCASLSETGINLLAEGLRLQLTNRQFGSIYDNATEFVHSNVSREDFIQRSRRIVEELQKLDEKVEWNQDDSLGNSFRIDHYPASTGFAAFRKIGEGDKKITILMYWSDRDGQIKFDGLSAVSASLQISTVGKFVESE